MKSSTISPVVCAAWCEDGTGHSHESSRADQVCMGAGHMVPVSTDDEGSPQELAVYEEQAPGAPVLVALSHNGGSGPALTLDEARSLRDALDSILSAHAPQLLDAA